MDIMTDHGAAAMNQGPQAMFSPKASSMKPVATRFCAAAVLMPIF
jgi:hypothetical protein